MEDKQYTLEETISNDVQMDNEKLNTLASELVRLSQNIPSIKISNDESIQAFFEDDGGY